MEAIGVAVLVVLAVLAVVGGWALRLRLDKNRIEDYVRRRGGRVVSINWAPWGHGWIGEKEERLYEVVYYDPAGNQHFATAKTSLLTGVFWTEDRVPHAKAGWYDSLAPGGKPLIRQLPQTAEGADADELRRLREENARLREQLGELTARETGIQGSRCPACGAAAAPGAARCPSCQAALR
jgi:hypothetical protein